MNEFAKKALKVALILASIGGVSAITVSAVNLFTAPKIEANRKEKEKKALNEIFPSAEVGEAVEIKENAYTSLLKYWPVQIGDEDARIYSCSGKNGYGAVSLLIGVYGDYSLGRMSIIDNTETYGQTLNQNYIAPYQYYEDAESRQTALDHVVCGATYGAKLIKGMVEQAVAHYKEAR